MLLSTQSPISYKASHQRFNHSKQTSHVQQQQSEQKALLRQLSLKVKDLIQQNKALRSKAQPNRLKTQLIAYINHNHISNQQTIEYLHDIIDKLQYKVQYLSKLSQHLKESSFQKKVQMQLSMVKYKNQITKCPQSTAESFFQSRQEKQNGQSLMKISEQEDEILNKSILRDLKKKNEDLHEQLSQMRQKWETQMELKIKEIGMKQQLLITCQKLKAEKKSLQYALNIANQQYTVKAPKDTKNLTKQQIKTQHIPLHTEPNNDPLLSELKDIKNSLIRCNKNSIHSLQAEIIQLIQERNEFRAQYLKLKNKMKSSESKSEVKLLMDKNVELQEKCFYYVKEIEKYESRLREMNEQRENKVVDNMMRDFQEMGSASKDDLGLKWSKATHHCILSTINRLQNLEQTLLSPYT